jgi:nitroimidazol reductase NimA-like FMN-containing flavoprotein (pyridoxamine 5'-phosphate oxidase superfamily)
MSHAMTRAEREAFLADVHVGVIGLTYAERSLAVPIWYGYEPGGEVVVLTHPESIKGRALEETRWYSLCAQDENPPYKYVTVEGPVTAIESSNDEMLRTMAHRYLGPEFGDLYVESTQGGSENRAYRMTPSRWFTVDYAKDFGG